jgi:RimJ/RimL family protein N-acetyltransferase
LLIRELRPTDFGDMAETFLSFFPEAEVDPSFGLVLPRQRPSMEDEGKWFTDTLRELEAGNAVITVAEVDSHVVGWCDVRRIGAGGPLDHRANLGICIRKEHRGQGIGTGLLREALAKCKGRFEVVELSVLASNPRAYELYRRFGFAEYGLLPRGIKRDGAYTDQRFMYLRL